MWEVYWEKMAIDRDRTAGTALVWVLWPERQRIDVWHRDDRAPIATLTPDDTLEGLDVVPGFTHPVADIFA